MTETEKLYVWVRVAQASGFLAVLLGFLRLNNFIPDALISQPEAIGGLIIGSGTLALAYFALKIIKRN